MAKETGGKSYGPFEGNLAPLPQIFIKEATVVKRSIIQEDPHGIPVRLAASSSDLVKGITPGPMPPLYGYDLTGRKDNPLIEVPMVAGPKRDPVLATLAGGAGKGGGVHRRCVQPLGCQLGRQRSVREILVADGARRFAFAVLERF